MTQDSAGPEPFETPLERYLPELKLTAQLLPHIGPALAQYFEDVVRRRRERVETIATSFSQESGVPFSELIDQASRNARMSDIIGDVLETGERTSLERKLRALGRALYHGYIAADDAALDELELMLKSLRDLEAPHIKVLDYLVQGPKGKREILKLTEEFAHLFPNGQRAMRPIIKALENHGLAYEYPGRGEWLPTSFGRLMHEKLLEEGAKQEDPWNAPN
jgi:hypothetical protein